MSGSNTVVIAAYIGGMKTTKAVNWSIPIVNHVWLEDCWVQWRALSVGLEKYIREFSPFLRLIRREAELDLDFPPGMDFSKILGERGGVGTRRIELDLEMDEEDFKEDVDTRDLIAVRGSDGQKSFAQIWQDRMATEVKGPVGTSTSARDSKEVEVVVGMFGDVDVGMDVDVSPSKKAKKREKVKELSDEERSPSKRPDKKRIAAKMKTKKTRVVSDEGDDAVEMDVEVSSSKKREKAKKLSDEEGSPSKRPEKKRIAPKMKMKKADSDEEVEIVQEKTAKLKLIRRTKPISPVPSRSDAKNRQDASSEPGDLPNPKHPSHSKSKRRPSSSDGSSEDDDPPVSKVKDSTSKSKSQKNVRLPSSSGGSSEDDAPPVSKVNSKSKSKRLPSSSGSSEDDEPPVSKKRKGRAVVEGTRKRVVSVVIDARRDPKKKYGVPRTESVRVQAEEASVGSPTKRDRPTKGGKREEKDGDEVAPLKRSAAVKAASTLRDVMMPDLMNYVQEKKRGFRGRDVDRVGWTDKTSKRRSSEGLSGDEETERKRRRLNSDEKKKSFGSEDDDDDDEGPSKAIKKDRAKPAVADESGDENSIVV